MKKGIEIRYSFESKAKILDRSSEELKQYEAYFEEKILPEIKKVERKKIESRNIAYQMEVSIFAKSQSKDVLQGFVRS